MNTSASLVGREAGARAAETLATRPQPAERSWPERLSAMLPFIVVLVAWELVVRIGLVHPLFLPAPSLVFQTIVRLMASGELVGHLTASLLRVILGFAAGAIPGVLLGLNMGWSRKVRVAMEPLVSALYPIPKVALLPMIMLLFGIGDLSKVIVIAIGVFFPALINAMTGVVAINPVFYEVAANCGASRWKTFTRVVVPGSLPMTFAGLRLAFGTALILVVTAEFVAARTGIGAMIWLAWETLRTEKLYAGVVMWAIIGVLSTDLLRRIERRVIRWQR